MTAITTLTLDQPAATLATLGLVRVVPVPAAICPECFGEGFDPLAAAVLDGALGKALGLAPEMARKCDACSGSGSVPPTVTGRITITASDKEPTDGKVAGLDGWTVHEYASGFRLHGPPPTRIHYPLPLGRVVGSAAAVIIPILAWDDENDHGVAHVCRSATQLTLIPLQVIHTDIEDHRPFGDWTLPYAALLTDPEVIS